MIYLFLTVRYDIHEIWNEKVLILTRLQLDSFTYHCLKIMLSKQVVSSLMICLFFNYKIWRAFD